MSANGRANMDMIDEMINEMGKYQRSLTGQVNSMYGVLQQSHQVLDSLMNVKSSIAANIGEIDGHRLMERKECSRNFYNIIGDFIDQSSYLTNMLENGEIVYNANVLDACADYNQRHLQALQEMRSNLDRLYTESHETEEMFDYFNQVNINP